MYKMALRLDVGSEAEDFMLDDYGGLPFRLGSLIGKGLVFLTFYRGGFDRESVRYLKELARRYPKLRELGVEVVAVTPELKEKAKNTAEALNLPFIVLSDPGLVVTRQYDVYDRTGEWCWPAGFIIGKNGTIEYAYRGVSAPNTPPLGYLLKKLEQLSKKETGAAAAAT